MNVNKNNYDLLTSLISQNNDRITTKEVTEAGIHRMYLKNLVDKGLLIQSTRGVYQKATAFDDELYNLQAKYNSGIFSYETSLYLHGLLERAPFTWTMTFKSSYHSETIKNENVEVKYSAEKLYSLEIETVESPAGNKVQTYSAERTLCEILKTKAGTDIQVITYAFRTYVKRKDKKIPKLMELAKIFHVENKVRAYLEVLV